MTVTLLGFDLHEFDVGLSDLILSLLAIYFLFKLYSVWSPRSILCIFIWLVLSSFLGAIFHFFFPLKVQTWTWFIVWIGVALSIVMVSYGILSYLISQDFSRIHHFLTYIPSVYCLFFIVSFLWVNQSYSLVIAFYTPIVVLLWVYWIYSLHVKKDVNFIFLITGVIFSLLAWVIQILKITPNLEYVTYNTFYHIVQGIGIYFIFIFFLKHENIKW